MRHPEGAGLRERREREGVGGASTDIARAWLGAPCEGHAQEKDTRLFCGFAAKKRVSMCSPLLPGCPEGSWLFERFGALSLNSRDLFGKRARRAGGLGKRQGTGP